MMNPIIAWKHDRARLIQDFEGNWWRIATFYPDQSYQLVKLDWKGDAVVDDEFRQVCVWYQHEDLASCFYVEPWQEAMEEARKRSEG